MSTIAALPSNMASGATNFSSTPSFPFESAPQTDTEASGFPWQQSGKIKRGQASTMLEPSVTYQATIACNSFTTRPYNLCQSEPLFGILGMGNNSIEKVYSLAQLNALLYYQHHEILEKLEKLSSTKRVREEELIDINKIVTEQNFSRKIVFLGFLSKESHNALGKTSSDNPAPPTLIISIHAKGKMEGGVYLWGGGKTRNPCIVGDHLGFVVKRMNLVDNIDRGDHKNFYELCRDVGPLQILPIAARRKNMFSAITFCKRTTDEVFESMAKGSHRRTWSDKEFGEVQKETTTITVSELLFRNLRDCYDVGAYERGINFVGISNFLSLLAREDNSAKIKVFTGMVIRVGYALATYCSAPPQKLVAQATSLANQSDESPDTVTNVSHNTLQSTYGMDFCINMDQGDYYCDVGADEMQFRQAMSR